MPKLTTAVVVPNWNGKDSLGDCLASLLAQTQPANIIVVDNGSRDGSVKFIKATYPAVHVIELSRNHGFAGGVNAGIRYALAEGHHFVALFNNDAVAEKSWLKHLLACLNTNPTAGIATGKLLSQDEEHLDSTGDYYTTWGLPYPRGRGERDTGQYDKDTWVFAASGGASLYRAALFEHIGLFDEAFFAYYEDVDLSFRAQLAGWRVAYAPSARAYHHIGATSAKVKGFTTYQTIKNLPMLLRKNVPLALMPQVFPRFWLAYSAFFWRAISRGKLGPALKGWFMASVLLPKNLWQRRQIQKRRMITPDYLRSILTHDLPPNARSLRRLRGRWHKLIRRHG